MRHKEWHPAGLACCEVITRSNARHHEGSREGKAGKNEMRIRSRECHWHARVLCGKKTDAGFVILIQQRL